jgi:hypothetical protein
MNQDALERLRNRAKPTVENRDSSPMPALNNPETFEGQKSLAIDNGLDISDSSNQEFKISTVIDVEQSESNSNRLSSSSMDLKTKQSTVRLEQKLSQRLSQFCLQEEVSREVLIEALFVYFENHKSMQPKVLQEARKRDQQRQKIANYRRAKSMIERFGLD